MRGRKERVVAACMLSALALGLLASCRQTKEEIQAEPVTFTFYNADGSEDPWSDPVALAITDATGVSIDTQYPTQGNEDCIALMIATGEYPDLIFAKGIVIC